MKEESHQGWRILYDGTQELLRAAQDIISGKGPEVQRVLKDNQRSRVLLVACNGRRAVFKIPREKNTRKWIRFTTLYRQGEAFKTIRSLEKLARMGIRTNVPMAAAEKRRFGMVVDSWMLYAYSEGRVCREADYPLVVEKVEQIHKKRILHGDAQINNFLIQNGRVFTIDCNPRKPLFGDISRYVEYFYLKRSAPGIEKYFNPAVKSFSYRIAEMYSRAYWHWRDFKKKKRQRKKFIRDILVIRLSSIGDVILTTPVLEALRTRFPDARISYLVMDAFKDAIEGNPNIDRLIVFPKKKFEGISGLIRFSRRLNKNHFDLIIDLHAKLRSTVIAALIKGRVLRYKKRSLWKSLVVPLHLARYHVDDSIVRNYFKPLEKLNVYFTREKLSFHFTTADMDRVKHYRDFIVFAPGAAVNTKQWPAENYAELGRMLREKIILIGAKEDFERFEVIRSKIGNSCKNLAGQLSLKESGALISLSKYVVTNDSGPFHIARGLSKKVFVIFGPTDPKMFDYDPNTLLIYAAAPCAPCSLHGDKACPKGHFECMRSLTPEKVYEIIRRSQSPFDEGGL